MATRDLSWSIPVMRAGYAGRGLVYLVVSGFSLYAIIHGGQAKGTSSALSQLESTSWGTVVLLAIFVGMVAFAVWRILDSLYDLEDCGTSARGFLARAAMLIRAIIYLGLAGLVFSLLFVGGEGGGGSSISEWVASIMSLPGGRWVVGAVGLIIMVSGGLIAYKGWQGKYREHLESNPFTQHWNVVLKAGVIAKGIVVVVIGILFVYAAWRFDPDAAGGTGEAFAWLTGQPYGRILVAAICVGLAAFAVYCFVNAAYRIVPKASGGEVKSLATRLTEDDDAERSGLRYSS